MSANSRQTTTYTSDTSKGALHHQTGDAEANAQSPVHAPPPPARPSICTPRGFAVSPDGRTVAIASDHGVIVAPVDPARKAYLLKASRANPFVDTVGFSGDGSTLAGIDIYGELHLWNLQTRKLVKTLPGTAATTNETLVSDPAGGVLIVGSNRVRFWDPAKRALPAPPVQKVGLDKAVFIDGGHRLVNVGSDGAVSQWEAPGMERSGTPTRPVRNVKEAAVSADGHTLAFADSTDTVWLWDLHDHAAPAALGHGPGEVNGLALTADGRTLAVATDRGTQLWDVRARRPLGKPLPGDAFSLAFTPDGHALVRDDASVVRIWTGILWRDVADLRSQICTLVVGDLTRAEWQAIAPDLPYPQHLLNRLAHSHLLLPMPLDELEAPTVAEIKADKLPTAGDE